MLNLNGYELEAEDCDLVELALDTVENRIDVQKIGEFFESYAVPISYPEL